MCVHVYVCVCVGLADFKVFAYNLPKNTPWSVFKNTFEMCAGPIGGTERACHTKMQTVLEKGVCSGTWAWLAVIRISNDICRMRLAACSQIKSQRGGERWRERQGDSLRLNTCWPPKRNYNKWDKGYLPIATTIAINRKT